MRKALKSQLEDVVLGLLKTPAQFDADELRYAMKVGLSADWDKLGLVPKQELVFSIIESKTNLINVYNLKCESGAGPRSSLAPLMYRSVTGRNIVV